MYLGLCLRNAAVVRPSSLRDHRATEVARSGSAASGCCPAARSIHDFPSHRLWFLTRVPWQIGTVAKVSTNRNGGERPRWGRVYIVAGRWKGRLGSYDDDDRGYCIVYPDGVAKPVLVRPSSIIEAPEPGEPMH